MKLSSKALACGQSPMRKFHPYAVAAAAAGKKIYHLNIGQPDIHTPDALYDAIHNFRAPVLAYAASPGIPELISSYGLTVFTEDSLPIDFEPERPIRVVDQWVYHSRLYSAAQFVAKRNDLELIQTAALGVAMGGGSPELARQADRTCPSVEEDGVAQLLEELGLA